MSLSKKKIKLGLIWSSLDSVINQGLSLCINLTLAKILGPSDFGLVAMLAIFIAIANVFVSSGFSTGLIRKADRDEKDYATAFYFSIIVAIVCYFFLFTFSPFIAEFYQQNELVDLTRVISLVIIINAFSIIPRTKLTIELNFKKQAQANLIGIILGGSTGLIMAYNDFGVWSLVTQQLVSSVSCACIINILHPWRPSESFCKKSFLSLFGFGSKLLLSGLIDALYKNIYGLIIGKKFSSTQLGVFNQANMLSMLPATTIAGIIQKVTYPMLSSIQDEPEKLDMAYLTTLKISTMVVFPLMLGICITSYPLVDLLLGPGWEGVAPLISILTMSFALYPIHAINLNMLQVKGRSDLFLKLEVIKKINITIMLMFTVPMGIEEMCIGMVVTSYIAAYINTYYTGKLSEISQSIQFKALFPIVIASTISASFGYFLGGMVDNNMLSLLVTLSISLIIYLSILFVFQKKLLLQVKSLLRDV